MGKKIKINDKYWDIRKIKASNNNSYIAIAGQSLEENICFLNFDKNGKIIWKKMINAYNKNFPHDVQNTHDGGYAVLLRTSFDFVTREAISQADFEIVKYNEKGDVEWGKIFDNSRNVYLTVIKNINNRYVEFKIITIGGNGGTRTEISMDPQLESAYEDYFDNVENIGTLEAYDQYINDCPKSPLIKLAKESFEKLSENKKTNLKKNKSLVSSLLRSVEVDKVIEEDVNGHKKETEKKLGWYTCPKTGCEIFMKNYKHKPGVKFYWNGPCNKGKIDGKGIISGYLNKTPVFVYEGNVRDGHITGVGRMKVSDNGKNWFEYTAEFLDGCPQGKFIVEVGGQWAECQATTCTKYDCDEFMTDLERKQVQLLEMFKMGWKVVGEFANYIKRKNVDCSGAENCVAWEVNHKNLLGAVSCITIVSGDLIESSGEYSKVKITSQKMFPLSDQCEHPYSDGEIVNVESSRLSNF